MFIKEKLLGLKTPDIQGMFRSFLGAYRMNILSIESKIRKIAICPFSDVTKWFKTVYLQNQTLYRDFNQELKFVQFLGRFFRENFIFG